MSKRSDHNSPLARTTPWLFIAAAALLLTGCERPPVDTVQIGYRGTGMEQVYNPRIVATQASLNAAPVALPAAPSDGPKAGETFKNVQVLGDQSVAEFTRTMISITAWVAPQQGCAYCHAAGEDLSSDKLYTKVVARKMLEMTRHINASWKPHVAETGVTCYTCHRGKPEPAGVWFTTAPQKQAASLVGDRAGQNIAATSVALAALPEDPFTPFLAGSREIRISGTAALPAGNRQSIKQAEWTYGLMMHMSQSLGVNCTYCHNSRSFSNWEESTPKRTTAWYGIRMARDLNNSFLEPLAAVFPADHKGPTGDVAKISCATCHQGAYKPLYGASLIKDHPELVGAKP